MIFYTVYRTQNIVNGKYYFGVHKTKNPYDGYLGSGKLMKRAIAKYGEQSFIKNICFLFDNPEEAFAKEFELIETYREDPLCYNLRQGGSGGFDWINREGKNGTYFITEIEIAKRGASRKKRFETDPVFRQNCIDHVTRIRALVDPDKREIRRVKATVAWTGQHHTEENRKKFSTTRMGSGNSQFGTCWIVKRDVVQKIRSSEVESYLERGWTRGRKIMVT